jgi:hypothetical protein
VPCLSNPRRQSCQSCSDSSSVILTLNPPFPLPQIAELLATFSLGEERVQASVLLFMRCSDPRNGLDQVLGVLGSRDAEEWRRNLQWYAGYCFCFPQGKTAMAVFRQHFWRHETLH